MALGLLLAGRRERLAATHPCGATGQLRHAAMSSSSSSSSRDGGSQSSEVDEPETTTTTNQSAALSSAVAKANEATEQRNRLKTELRRAKPAGGTHKVWEYYVVYVNTKYKDLAICLWCDRAERYTAAERKFKDMSPTNLMHHLNTNLPGHRDAYNDVKRLITPTPGGGGAGSAVVAGELAPGQTQMTSFLNPLDRRDVFIRFIVMTNQPISVGNSYDRHWASRVIRETLGNAYLGCSFVIVFCN